MPIAEVRDERLPVDQDGVAHMTGAEPTVVAPPAVAAGAVLPGARGRRPGWRRRERRVAFVFLTPWIAGMVLLTIGPMLYSLYLSFTDYDLLTPPEFTGLDNYQRMFSGDLRFMRSVGVTLRYVAFSVPLVLAFALFLAMVLNRGMRALPAYRALFYLPSLMGASVAVAVLWRQVFGENGIVNQALSYIGLGGNSWIGSPDTALYTLVVLNVWTFGSTMIIFLAGLRQIPPELYEAAAVDGASAWHRFRHVTLPMLSPLIFFNLLLVTIHAFQAFTPAYVVSNGTGGPADSTLFYTLYLYEEGFTKLNMGYAAAMAWLLVAVLAVYTAVLFATARFWVFYGDER